MVERKECEHLGLRVEKGKIGENHDNAGIRGVVDVVHGDRSD